MYSLRGNRAFLFILFFVAFVILALINGFSVKGEGPNPELQFTVVQESNPYGQVQIGWVVSSTTSAPFPYVEAVTSFPDGFSEWGVTTNFFFGGETNYEARYLYGYVEEEREYLFVTTYTVPSMAYTRVISTNIRLYPLGCPRIDRIEPAGFSYPEQQISIIGKVFLPLKRGEDFSDLKVFFIDETVTVAAEVDGWHAESWQIERIDLKVPRLSTGDYQVMIQRGNYASNFFEYKVGSLVFLPLVFR